MDVSEPPGLFSSLRSVTLETTGKLATCGEVRDGILPLLYVVTFFVCGESTVLDEMFYDKFTHLSLDSVVLL